MSSYEYIYPEKLNSGDTIGIVAPASPFDRETFNQGISVLHELGFNTYVPDEVWQKQSFLAGSDDNRAELINELFADPAIKAIICARGGYGSMRILEKIDYRIVRENPKIFVGFSDISALLSVFFQRVGLVCFHGPVITTLACATKSSENSLKNVLLSGFCEGMHAEKGHVVFSGWAEGHLAGGNLSTLCHLAGTEFAPDFNGRIVLFEDVGEAPYRIDRMLTQMRLAGLFEGIRGVAIGTFENCGTYDEIESVFENTFNSFHIPLVSGFSFGHSEPNMLFPIGGKAKFDSVSLTLDFS